MDCASKFRTLRAPSGDGQTLVDPPYAALPDTVINNREALATADYDVQGRSLAELSKAARERLWKLAVEYTSQYREVPEHWRSLKNAAETPFVLSGHQPEMFHPGVWYKNFVLGGLARRMDGVGIHLSIDSDLCRGASIRVPTGGLERPRVEAVPYDKPGPEVPYEERSIRDKATFSTFGERVSAVIRPLVDEPMVAALWPLMMERNPQQSNLGLRLAQGRHALEQSWNNETLELPQSVVCQMPEFGWFTAHLLAHLPRFRTAYNKALGLYRCAHKMRNRAHPMPDLAAEGEWLEAPFWIWSAEDPERRPLFARQSGGEIVITDRRLHSIALPLGPETDPSAAAEQLAELSSRGVKVRTRALTTTLFARLVLSDVFLHGIGGAKYDRVTDQIVRLFFGFEPPEFATVSGTLRLPINHASLDGAAIGQWEERLRELRYHPEQYVDLNGGANGDSAALKDIVATKEHWLHTPKTHENARERHLAIAGANDRLQPYVASLREQIERERVDTQHRKRSEAILNSREYSFCLYPREHFDKLLLEPGL
ncbi:MAG TPA: hypothetical protein VH107_10905 [Lacipirellulaceae bacterium]|nr:hypothetical protein [Lacipirellulaceae bacterium]